MNRWRISYYLKNQTGLNEQRISNLHIRLINSKIMDENEKQMMMSLRKQAVSPYQLNINIIIFKGLERINQREVTIKGGC